MNERKSQRTRKHNIVLAILSIAAIAVVAESMVLGWEFWVPPLIIGMLVGVWVAHILQFRQAVMRENYYLIFGMVIALYHGVHPSGFFDVLAISVVLMTTAAFIRRREFLVFMFAEFFVIMAVQLALENKYASIDFDAQTLLRILLHVACEICCYVVLKQIIVDESENNDILDDKDAENTALKNELDDLLEGISTNLNAQTDEEIRNRMIYDIGQYGCIRKGNMRVAREEYSVIELVDSAISSGGRYAKTESAKLIVDLDPSVPAGLRGDHDKLLMIIEHLLDNAFKFTKRGGVYLRVTGIRHDDSFNLVIEVHDTGKGMDISVAEEISAGSFRHNDTDDKLHGIGLGLGIVYGYARCMNGFVYFDSEEHKGTIVKVSVPQEVVDPHPCMELSNGVFLNVIYYADPGVSRHPKEQEYFKRIANNLASSLRFNLYYASSIKELERYAARGNITNIITGKMEYEADAAAFDRLAGSAKLTVLDSGAEVLYTKKIYEVLNSRPADPPTKGGRA